MFQGLRTVIYPAADLDAAKQWYSTILGKSPYFDQPFYVGFSVAGYELGLDPNIAAAAAQSTGGLAYWGVENVDAALQHLLNHGATVTSAVQDVGDGIRVATITDPFGNAVGIIENPHFSLEDS